VSHVTHVAGFAYCTASYQYFKVRESHVTLYESYHTVWVMSHCVGHVTHVVGFACRIAAHQYFKVRMSHGILCESCHTV